MIVKTKVRGGFHHFHRGTRPRVVHSGSLHRRCYKITGKMKVTTTHFGKVGQYLLTATHQLSIKISVR